MVRSGIVLSPDASLRELQLRDGDLLTLVVKPASSFVLFGTAGGVVESWDIDECNKIRTFVGHLINEVITADDVPILNSMFINAVAFSRNGILALTGSNDGTARLWNTDNGNCIQCFDSKLRNEYSSHPVPVTSVGFVVNGEFRNSVVTGNGDGSIMLWSMEDMGRLLRTAWPHGNACPSKYVSVAMLSHDGSSAFSAVHFDGRLKMWSVASGICIKYFLHGYLRIDRAVLSSDGDILLTAGCYGPIKSWDISSGECIRTFGGCFLDGPAICVDLSSDGKFVIGIGVMREAVLWEVRTGEVSRRFQHPCGQLNCVALSSDIQFALTGGCDGSVRIWNILSDDCAGILRSTLCSGVTVSTFAP